MKRFWIHIVFLLYVSLSATAAEIWVSPKGNNSNPGTKDKPLADLGIALRKAREMRRLGDPSIKGGISIMLRGGVYRLEEPIVVRPEDSGTAESPTVIKAAAGEEPILSGGIQVKGWQKVPGTVSGLPAVARGQVWVADAPVIGDNVLDFRQLWVNNVKAIRSRDVKLGTMSRILSWNHQEETCWIPKSGIDLSKAKGMEMLIHQWWAIATLRVKSAEQRGDSVKLSFYQPESRVQSEHPWPAPWISKTTGNSAVFLSNAIEFLNEPGEWYLDKLRQKIYYWPRKNENLRTAEVIVPYLETLVKMEGTIDHPVTHVSFRGISFQHSTWLRPSREGHVPHQAGMYMLDAYKLKIPGTPDKKGLENQAWVGRPAAAVTASFTKNTGFENCRFEHLASTGLDYHRGNHSDLIKGNLFKDIGGTGILTGVFSDEAQEVHLPYNPTDERDVSTNLTISNNVVTDVTNEDWGCVGIGAGHVKGITIANNDISEVSYSGVSMGWGWTRTLNSMRNNRIIGNKIHRYGKHLYDVSAIYTLSAQPGSTISENYIDSIYKAPYAHDPNHWFYLYTDEGSSYFTVKDNWTPSDKYLQNANGPGNVWTNNGPQVADSIRRKAGIQEPYRHLLKDRAGRAADREINRTEKFKVVELIGASGTQHDVATVQEVIRPYGMTSDQIYRWNNRTVIYAPIEHPERLRKELLNRFPQSYVKIYSAPLYEFNRKQHCPQATIAKEWDHVLLTANLVKDSIMQKEYVDHHATQFKLWLEVARGFCNADFQRLQVFKNAGQLMLIISIPKGANLSELNPRTTANNPRVDEWNSLMAKYQEGVEGTKAGEIWVFLEKIR
jgi:hypothetical protein